ncbi:MAG: ferrochelatase [Chitinophagales bacterium]
MAKELNISEDNYTITYQSRLGKDPWMQPYTDKVLEELAHKGIKKVLVFCPAFVADCLETIFEIGVEYQEEFEEAGGEKVALVESLNTHPLWVEAVKEMILEN